MRDNWSERFDELFIRYATEYIDKSGFKDVRQLKYTPLYADIKSFISKELERQRREIVDKMAEFLMKELYNEETCGKINKFLNSLSNEGTLDQLDKLTRRFDI